MRFVYEMFAQGLTKLADGNEVVWGAAGRTLWLAACSTLIALAIGLPVAIAIAQARPRVRRFGFVTANAGLGLPPVVVGVFLALFLASGVPLIPSGWLYTLRGMVTAQVLLALPIVVALSASAIAGLPDGLLTQARAFGAGPLARGVLAVREARVGVVAAVIAALGSAVAEVGAVVIVGGNTQGRTDTLASAILLNLSAGDAAGATADIIVLLSLMLILGIVFTVIQNRSARDAT